MIDRLQPWLDPILDSDEKVLVILTGVQGSGKSTIGSEIMKKYLDRLTEFNTDQQVREFKDRNHEALEIINETEPESEQILAIHVPLIAAMYQSLKENHSVLFEGVPIFNYHERLARAKKEV